MKKASVGSGLNVITDETRWDEQQRQNQASFLQSSGWGTFQKSLGHSYHLLAGEGWSCLLIERKTPSGRYLFAPLGPTITDIKTADSCFQDLKSFAQGLGADWLRLEPLAGAGDNESIIRSLKLAGGRPAPHNVQPGLTRVVDLRPSVEELLASISQATRSFIRKNQRENILSFNTSTKPADMKAFATMLRAVGDRKGVSFYSETYFAKQAETLMPAGTMFLELAYDSGKLVGAAVIHDFGKTSSYTYAASKPEARKKNVSALLLWQAMQNAKARGMQEIDLFGVAPEDAPESHPWYGFTSFKRKFGGRLIERAGTWDIPLSSKYRLYRLIYKSSRLLKRR